jgi:hydroxymethylpyrimidine/phosphomethylpyrimidine kinase
VLTAITAQNTVGVRRAEALAPDLVRAQLEAVLEDLGADAVKTGMLATAPIVETVADLLQEHRVKQLVVDPVMLAKSGDPLLDEQGCEALQRRILPLARVLTPNLPEASKLLGRTVGTLEEMVSAAPDLQQLGPRAVLLKGGHLSNPERATDVLHTEDGETYLLESPWYPVGGAHGTGCTLSAALAAHLALGLEIVRAAVRAKAYLSAALAAAPLLGHGARPLNHSAEPADPEAVTLRPCE